MLILDLVNLILFRFFQRVGLRGGKQANNELGKAGNSERVSSACEKCQVHPVTCTGLSCLYIVVVLTQCLFGYVNNRVLVS